MLFDSCCVMFYSVIIYKSIICYLYVGLPFGELLSRKSYVSRDQLVSIL